MRTSRCSRRACARTTCSPSRRTTRACMPKLFSVECWGGATFDVAMRFLQEDPWERLTQLRAAHAEHAVPDAAALGERRRLHELSRQRRARTSCSRRRSGGIDVFRIFDSLNWVENMRVAIDAVRETGKLCEAAICYTGDISRSERRRSTPASTTSTMAQRARRRRRAHPRHQGHGRAVPAARRVHAGQGAEGRDRPADALPHARHQRHRRGQRARGGRRRRATRSTARSTR